MLDHAGYHHTRTGPQASTLLTGSDHTCHNRFAEAIGTGKALSELANTQLERDNHIRSEPASSLPRLVSAMEITQKRNVYWKR